MFSISIHWLSFDCLGFYIYAEASSPAMVGNTARLLSKTFPSTTARCMKFWYSMNGMGVGSLRVYIKTGSFMEKIWEKNGNQGQEWNMGEITLHSSTEYKVKYA